MPDDWLLLHEAAENPLSHKGRGDEGATARVLSRKGRAEGKGGAMKPFLSDVPFKGSRRVYLAIKLLVIVLALMLALHFVFGVV